MSRFFMVHCVYCKAILKLESSMFCKRWWRHLSNVNRAWLYIW